MEHPFVKLKPEYSQLLSAMVVRDECKHHVDKVATQILGFRSRFDEVTKATGVPLIFSGPSFYREADLNFNLSPSQGDPWRRVSTHVPRGLGPYPSWIAAAVAAYHREGLDKIGAGNWIWELICFYGELFNGFGYRDWHHMHSPYLWGGTNIQSVGKYTSDGHFDEHHMDEQLGVIPIARRITEIAPDLAITSLSLPIPQPQHSGLAKSENAVHTTLWLQESLNKVGFEIQADGSYGRETKHAVAFYEHAMGLDEDGGYAGPQVMGSLEKAVANLTNEGANG